MDTNATSSWSPSCPPRQPTLDKSVELVLGHALGLRAVHVAQGTNTNEVVDKVTQDDDIGQNDADHLNRTGHRAAGSEVERSPNCHDEYHADGEHGPPDTTALGVVSSCLRRIFDTV